MLLTYSWHGSVLLKKKDASGLTYLRNLMYDPGTGRFTQEDPIGLAGGLNAYGYANGDPVSFSDPFGLCPDNLSTAKAIACALIEGTSMILGSGAGFFGGGGASNCASVSPKTSA